MEGFDETGDVLLGYNRQQGSLGGDPSSSSVQQHAAVAAERDSDEIDFKDVFGGPPRRFSMHETRYSFGGGKIEVERAVIVAPVSSWPGFGEKPVFGESPRRYDSPRRGTSTNDDFFDDIFRGSDDSYSSPRHSRPGSRIMSPAHPKFEPLSTSLPAPFSLPAKLTKAMDLPTFSPGSHSPHRFKEGTSGVYAPNTLSRFSSLTVQAQDDFRNNPGLSPGLSSNQSLFNTEVPFDLTKHMENEVERIWGENTCIKEAPSNSSEFHFSIHKWPGREVPVLASLRGGYKPTFKANSKVGVLSTAIVEDADILVDDSSVDRGDMKTYSVSKMSLSEQIENEISTLKQDETEGQGDEESDHKAEGKENMERVTGSLNSKIGTTGSKKNEAKKMNASKKGEGNKPVVGLPKSSGENLGKGGVKGKVKEFVKIFNEEGPPKSKMNAVARSLSSRWKATGNKRGDSELSDSTVESESKVSTANAAMKPDAPTTTALDREVSTANVEIMPDDSSIAALDGKAPVPNMKMMADPSSTAAFDDNVPEANVKMMPDASSTREADSKVDAAKEEHVENASKKQFAQNRTIKTINDIQFDRINASPSTESVPPGTKVTDENIEEPSLENFQVQELSPDEDKLPKTEEETEAFKASDSKIQLWSNGRKGNIRSLLSTLQLVLWPESGWKPVALVDIIEANAVKKAYNRAMLCLHPDKLQQKGAASHQKYLAAKVFDILQEAWDHFNSLGTLL